jgi:hypothetical protein
VLADPVVLAAPVLPDPVLADPVLADPVLADPVLADPVLADPVLADPVLACPAPAAGGVLTVGLVPAPPEAGGLDAGDTGVDELPLTGVDTAEDPWGLAVSDGWAELVEQGVPVASAV